MIVLDTNVVSGLMRTPVNEPIRQWIAARGPEELAITTVSIFEIAYGIQRLPLGKRRTSLEQKFGAVVSAPDMFVLCTMNESAARRAGAYLARRDALGRPTTDADMMIAGIAAELGAAIATRNVHDFEGLELTVIDPWAL